jgi:uncharacterized membrane protein
MENEEESSLFGLGIDPESAATLRTASQWARLLSILGFILGTLVLIFGLILYNKILASYGSDYIAARTAARMLANRYLIACVLFAAVLMTGAVLTLNFSNRTMTALDNNDQSALNGGLSAMKSGIIFWSIVFILFIIIMLFLFLAVYSI